MAYGRSLCKAAVVQNAMQVFCVLARRVLRFIPCARFILSWAERAVMYILSYTICFVGIYGLDFSQGAVLFTYDVVYHPLSGKSSQLDFFV